MFRRLTTPSVAAPALLLAARGSPSPYLYFFRATNVSSDASGGHANLTGV